MAQEITHVRLDNVYGNSEQHISQVKLSSGIIQSVQQAVSNIDTHVDYYFTDHNGKKAEVESVHHGYSAYIRTKPNQTTTDNLLSLPRF